VEYRSYTGGRITKKATPLKTETEKITRKAEGCDQGGQNLISDSCPVLVQSTFGAMVQRMAALTIRAG